MTKPVDLVLGEGVGLARWESKFLEDIIEEIKDTVCIFLPWSPYFQSFVSIGLNIGKMLNPYALKQAQVLYLFKFFMHLTSRI